MPASLRIARRGVTAARPAPADERGAAHPAAGRSAGRTLWLGPEPEFVDAIAGGVNTAAP